MFCVNWHRRKRMFLSGVSLFLTFSPALKAQRIRYLSLPEIQDTLYRFSGSGLPGTDIADAIHWDQWIGEQDSQVRSRIDRGVEDSISNFILYGTSYTTLPRLEGSDRSLTSSGELSSEARARIHALTVALTSRPHNERLEFVRQYLSKKGVPRNQVEDFLGRNLTRFATEQRHYQDELERATTSSDPNAVLLTRGTLYQNRGLSIDTSLLPNYAVEDTLRRLAAKNVVGPASIRRIADIRTSMTLWLIVEL